VQADYKTKKEMDPPNICLSTVIVGSLLRCADFSADVNSGTAF